jgi:hypothetical protein
VDREVCRPREGGRSTVDLTVAGGRSSPELGLAAAPGHGGLPRRHGRQDGGEGTLVVGSPQAARRASGGGERNSAAVLDVRGARVEEVKRGERG